MLNKLQFNEEAVSRLFTEANLRPLRYWTDADSGYSLWLLERPPAKGSVGTDFQK
jgi:L-histidine Nalpha-methyltransferase / hercynylcysteine S-oxide synthase